MTGDTVVIGLGQALRGDDAAGREAVRLWRAAHPGAEARVELIGLPGLQLLEFLKGASAAVIVDAVQSGAPPGTLHLLNESEIAAFGAGAGSAHGFGVAETLALGRELCPDELPGTIVVVGIEIAQMELGQPLSPAVKAALPQAAQMIDSQVRRGRKTAPPARAA